MSFNVTVTDAAAVWGFDDQSAGISDVLDAKLGSWVSTSQNLVPGSGGTTGSITFHYAAGYSIELDVWIAQDQSVASIYLIDLVAPTGQDLVRYSGSMTVTPGTFATAMQDAFALQGNDTITGNAANDTLQGYAGNDSIDGGAGTDTAVFSGLRSAYSVASASGKLTVTGPDGTDVLTNVERLQFDDSALAFDISGTAGKAYRLYQAAFDRAPDLGGLGYQMHDLDTWFTLEQVAGNFIASPEFQSKYGNVDNTGFITLLYENVLHREPDAGGLQYHLGELASGQTRADVLIHFSESPENQANVIGAIGNGMVYVPYFGG
jgi:hypothetical protein